MWGKFQQSELRIEVEATEKILKDSLLNIEQIQKWFFPLKFQGESKPQLTSGDIFTFKLGLVEVQNKVEIINTNCYRLILSGGIDGYQEWCWGDGWIQSRLEGISILPLNLAQTVNLLRLKSWLNIASFKREKNSEKIE